MAEIEQLQADEQARIEAARLAAETAPVYFLQAAIFGDADAATAMLTDLIDSGHDGTLIAEQSGDSVLYELHLGPYETLSQAETTATVVRRSHGLSPTVIVVQSPEAGAESE